MADNRSRLNPVCFAPLHPPLYPASTFGSSDCSIRLVRRSRAWRINFAKEFPSVHVPLSGRNAGVPGQHLQLVNGHPLVRQSRQGFVPHVVPVKVDPGERFAVRHAVATSLSCRLDAVDQQAQSLPRRSEALHVGSGSRPRRRTPPNRETRAGARAFRVDSRAQTE